ncbi:MAG: protein SCO1/2 [Myxococcota bacterium]|jgi:protein SCO1/2
MRMRLVTLFLWMSACAVAPETSEVPPAPEVAAAPAELPGDSIYQLEIALENQDGGTIDLAVHRGHPTLVSMFYANCPMACPMLIGDIKALEAGLSEAERAEVRVLLVSLDPERDTPELLSGVVETHDLDTARWTLARTDADDVREVAAVLGIAYRALDDGEMNHSSIVTLVDRLGAPVQRMEGLGQDASAVQAAVARMMK